MEGKIGETQTSKSASEMLHPSVTMIPLFKGNYSLERLSNFDTHKNLTEYHMKTSHITKDIISIEQYYEAETG